MIRTKPLVTSIAAALFLVACAGTPKTDPQIAYLERTLTDLRGDSRIAANAAEELREAEGALAVLQERGRRMDKDEFDQRIYITGALLKIAEAEGLADYADERRRDLSRQREKLVAEARRAELERTRYALASANADADQQRSLKAQAEAEAAEASRQAEWAKLDAEVARNELDRMQSEMEKMKAKETERGWLLTLGDVLFEVDRAELKPGAHLKLNELAKVLKNNAETRVEIEGHTDSTGGRDHNLALSQRRAEAVRSYLIEQGVSASRISARGMGPDYPIASNGDPAGRTQNRRVDIVIQTDDGQA